MKIAFVSSMQTERRTPQIALLDDHRVPDRVLVEYGFGQAHSARIPDPDHLEFQRLNPLLVR